MSSLKLEDILIEQGLLQKSDLSVIYQAMKSKQLSLTTVLLTEGKVKEPFLLKALEKLYELPAVDLKHYEIDQAAIEIVPREFCEKHCLIPLQKAGATLLVAFSEPRQTNVIESLRQLSKCRIQALVCTDLTIAQNIVRYYAHSSNHHIVNNVSLEDGNQSTAGLKINYSHEIADKAAVNKSHIVGIQQDLMNILSEADAKNATVIEFDLLKNQPQIQFKIDGRFLNMDLQLSSSSVELLEKLMSLGQLKTLEKNELQKFDYKFQLSNHRILDCHIFIIPQIGGYRCQIQLISKKNEANTLETIGLEDDDIKIIKNLIRQQIGLVLLTSHSRQIMRTFLHSLLPEIKLHKNYVLSIEDHYILKHQGIHQVIEPETKARQSLLNQIAEIEFEYLSISEIERTEELSSAIRYVHDDIPTLTSLKSIDAASAILKMMEMGIPPYVLNSHLQAVIGVKLVSKICEQCRVQVAVPQHVLLQIGVPQAEVSEFRVFKGKGCSSCHNTGIKGKIPVIEILSLNDKIRDALMRGANAGQIRYLARESGMKSMKRNILMKINKGMTTLDEFHFATMREN